MDLNDLNEMHAGKDVIVRGERKTIASFGYKASGEDLNRTLINFTDGTWDWAEFTTLA